MTAIVKAKYDAATQTLHLSEPLEGFATDDVVTAVVNKADPPRPWSHLRGSLSKEAGDELAAAIDDMFPIEK